MVQEQTEVLQELRSQLRQSTSCARCFTPYHRTGCNNVNNNNTNNNNDGDGRRAGIPELNSCGPPNIVHSESSATNNIAISERQHHRLSVMESSGCLIHCYPRPLDIYGRTRSARGPSHHQHRHNFATTRSMAAAEERRASFAAHNNIAVPRRTTLERHLEEEPTRSDEEVEGRTFSSRASAPPSFNVGMAIRDDFFGTTVSPRPRSWGEEEEEESCRTAQSRGHPPATNDHRPTPSSDETTTRRTTGATAGPRSPPKRQVATTPSRTGAASEPGFFHWCKPSAAIPRPITAHSRLM